MFLAENGKLVICLATIGAIITPKESLAAMQHLLKTPSKPGDGPRLGVIGMVVCPEHMAKLLSEKENTSRLSPEEQAAIATNLKKTRHWGQISLVVRSSHVETTIVTPVLESERHLLVEYKELEKKGKVTQHTPLPKGEVRTLVFRSGIHPDALRILTRASYEFMLEHNKTSVPDRIPSGSPV
jgi:hypothetical protein